MSHRRNADGSFAAENECRVSAMAPTFSHIERRLGALRSTERLTRHEVVTEEVVELALGTQAHAGPRSTGAKADDQAMLSRKARSP